MRKRPPSEGRPLPSLLCFIFGHHYRVSREITRHVKEYRCMYCERHLTTDADGGIQELTEEKRQINEKLRAVYGSRR